MEELIQALYGMVFFICLMNVGITNSQMNLWDSRYTKEENIKFRQKAKLRFSVYTILSILLFLGLFVYYELYYK